MSVKGYKNKKSTVKGSSHEVNLALVDDLFREDTKVKKVEEVKDEDSAENKSSKQEVAVEEEVADSWDTMFDDNGDSVADNKVDKLTNSVRKVKVEDN